MKNNAAVKPTHGWFLILIFVVPCLWGLVFWVQDWPLGVIAALMSVYLVVDGWNLFKMKRDARKDSES